MLVRLAAVAALVGSLALPAGASAAPVSDATLDFAHEAGVRYWRARGLEPCPDATTIHYRARRLSGVYANAWLWGKPRCVVTYNRRINWRAEGEWYGVTGRTFFCSVVVHEAGHLAGLEHTRRGIMRGDSLVVIPPICKRRSL